MKIVVFGDVHGNIIALEKLFKLEARDTDLFVSHGDIVNYGPWSNECVEFLQNVDNCNVLKGNHEANYILGNYSGKHPVARCFFNYCYPKFDKDLIQTINKYKNELQIEGFRIQHTINNQYIYADTDISKIEFSTNYIIGHSHQQFGRIKKGFSIFNTGSLGQNREYINQSCYLKINTKTNDVEFKNFNHDIDKVINQMRAEKYPSICIDYYLSKKRI